MTTIVVDASVAISWLVDSQRTASADAFLTSPGGEWIAPAIFSIEVRSVLLKLERRRLIDARDTHRALESLEAIGIRTEPPETIDDLDPTLVLARTAGVTIYDAFYLGLALRADAALASRDAALLAAAGAAGLRSHDLRS